MDSGVEASLDAVGPRLRALRTGSELTLSELSEATGISVSTLSRLESGQRKPTLELLLPLARAHGIPLDELVEQATASDPIVRAKPIRRGAMVMVPLTTRPGSLQAWKITVPAGSARREPKLATHAGYEWLYVLNGRLRMLLGDQDLLLRPGEAAELDTRLPHWFGASDNRAVEFLSIFSREGERMHVRARTTAKR